MFIKYELQRDLHGGINLVIWCRIFKLDQVRRE